jgi:hypothetical protein
MSHSFVRRSVAIALMTALALPFNPAAVAGNHPLSAVADVNTHGLRGQRGLGLRQRRPPKTSNPSQVLDRDVHRQRAAGDGAEQVHHDGGAVTGWATVYVYKNALFGNNVDIRMLNTDGRSAANASGWGLCATGPASTTLAMDKAPEIELMQLGKVITHELGHYTYGLFDEYREEGKALDPASTPAARPGWTRPKTRS